MAENIEEDPSPNEHLPTQETPDGHGGASDFSASWSSNSSIDPLSRSWTENDLFGRESYQFWNSIEPSNSRSRKGWRNFKETLERTFTNDPLATDKKKNYKVLKFIGQIFFKMKGNPEDLVNIEKYSQLLAWFGPFKPNENGRCVCLANINRLIEESSTRISDHEKESWFAGYLSSAEADQKLRGKNRGEFLIRFSESDSSEGGFNLGVVNNPSEAPAQISIYNDQRAAAFENPYQGRLHIDESIFYHDLVDLVEHFRVHPLSLGASNGVRLTNACPNLPWNSVFTGYANR